MNIKYQITLGAALILTAFVLAVMLEVFAPFCFLAAGILACLLPFIRQKARDGYFQDLIKKGILK